VSTLDLRSEATRRSNSRRRARAENGPGHKSKPLEPPRPAWRPNSNATQSLVCTPNVATVTRHSHSTASEWGYSRNQVAGSTLAVIAALDSRPQHTVADSLQKHSTQSLTIHALHTRVSHLEQQLKSAVLDLTHACGAADDTQAAAEQLSVFSVTFGAGKLGMVVTQDANHQVVVTELKHDAHSRRPLLALASGAMQIGDVVLALNGEPLGLLGSLHQVSNTFSQARRPLTLLIRRNTPLHVHL